MGELSLFLERPMRTENLSTALAGALPIVAAAYGEKFGVKVIFHGEIAKTDGKTIVLPTGLPARENPDVMWGYLAHEAAHVRFTDWNLVPTQPLIKTMLNVLEDARIDRAIMAVYPGTAGTLDAVAEYMVRKGHYIRPAAGDPPVEILLSYCLFFLQCNYVGQKVLQEFWQAAEQAFVETFPGSAKSRLDSLLKRAGELRNTEDALRLAEQILLLLHQEAFSSEEDDQSFGDTEQGNQSSDSAPGSTQRSDVSQGACEGGEQGDQSSDGASGSEQRSDVSQGTCEGDGQSDQSADGASGSEDPSGVSQGACEGDEQGEQSSGHVSGSGAQSGTSQRAFGSGEGQAARERLQEALSPAGAQNFDPHSKFVEELFCHQDNQKQARLRSVPVSQEMKNHLGASEHWAERARRAASGLRTRLSGLVQANRRTGSVLGQAGSRIHASRIHRVSAGDTKVFQKRWSEKKPNTAVHILLDNSSSMSGGRHHAAKDAALALGLALEGISKVNPAITMFAGSAMKPVFSVVRHGERVSSNAGKVAAKPHGSTPMGEAVWYALFELSKVRCDRAILVVVTDGEPNKGSPIRESLALAERCGVEVLGIGIKAHSIASLIRQSVVISDVSELKAVLFDLLKTKV